MLLIKCCISSNTECLLSPRLIRHNLAPFATTSGSVRNPTNQYAKLPSHCSMKQLCVEALRKKLSIKGRCS